MIGFPDVRAALVGELRRPRTLLGALALAAGAAIAGNALFLQDRPHPSPLVATRDDADDGREAPVGDPLVRSVQDALTQAGFYSGPLDGLMGPLTQSAILRFEAEAGRERTGEPSLPLLDAVRSATGSGLALRPPPKEAPADATAVADEQVAAVQRALALSAYGPLQADGVLGPETREAIMRFQRDHDLPVTGEITDALVVELRAAGAMRDG